MSKKLWSTVQIMVPAEMFQVTKSGKLSAKKTLTKTNAIAKNKNMGAAIKLLTHDSNSIEIVSNGDLKSAPEKAAPKARKKAEPKKAVPKAKPKTEPKSEPKTEPKKSTPKAKPAQAQASPKKVENNDQRVMNEIVENWANPSPGEMRALFYEHTKLRKVIDSLDEKINRDISISACHLLGLFGREFNEALLSRHSIIDVLKGLNDFGDDIPNFKPFKKGNYVIKKGWMSEKNRKRLTDYIDNMD
jgi:hypothetical protein